jgi:hypothetical protein
VARLAVPKPKHVTFVRARIPLRCRNLGYAPTSGFASVAERHLAGCGRRPEEAGGFLLDTSAPPGPQDARLLRREAPTASRTPVLRALLRARDLGERARVHGQLTRKRSHNQPDDHDEGDDETNPGYIRDDREPLHRPIFLDDAGWVRVVVASGCDDVLI